MHGTNTTDDWKSIQLENSNRSLEAVKFRFYIGKWLIQKQVTQTTQDCCEFFLGVGGFPKILCNLYRGSWQMLTSDYKVGGWGEKRPKTCLRNIWMVPKGPFNDYLRVLWGFFQPPTYLVLTYLTTFSVHNVRKYFPNHLPTPICGKGFSCMSSARHHYKTIHHETLQLSTK